MPERHTSLYRSLSPAPWRAAKCPKETKGVEECLSHNPQVETDRGTSERAYHGSPWPARGWGDPSLLARGAERASHLAIATVVGGEGHFTLPLHPSYFTGHFTPERRASTSQTIQIEASPRAELHEAETLYEAGATPPFDAPCVTASVGSLPPQSRAARDPFGRVPQRSFRVVRQRPLHPVREKGRTRSKHSQYNPKRAPAQVRDGDGIGVVLGQAWLIQ